jgi:23S rRNA (guanine745-N1)-methyltransferase
VIGTLIGAVVAIPGSSHLASLRDALGLIGIQEDKERLVLERFEDEFELAARTEVAYAMELSAEALSDLVGMGPSSRHRAGREALPAETTMTEASFVILRLRRK